MLNLYKCTRERVSKILFCQVEKLWSSFLTVGRISCICLGSSVWCSILGQSCCADYNKNKQGIHTGKVKLRQSANQTRGKRDQTFLAHLILLTFSTCFFHFSSPIRSPQQHSPLLGNNSLFVAPDRLVWCIKSVSFVVKKLL